MIGGVLASLQPRGSTAIRQSQVPSGTLRRPQFRGGRLRLLPVAQAAQPQESERSKDALLEAADSGNGASNSSAADSGGGSDGAKSDEYSREMQAKMGTTLEYRHEDGVNWNQILPDLYVGSCMQTPADVDRVREELGVGSIVSLQQDVDMAYFGLDMAPIQARCRQRGDVAHVRAPIRDFDPYDLRLKLPGAVAQVCAAASSGRGPVYIHCTAGLGRAPAVAMAWMYWCRGFTLPDAVQTLTSQRACSPKIFAIRQATVDVLYPESPVPVTIGIGLGQGEAQSVKIAGLDVGWGQFLDLSYSEAEARWQLTRAVRPGSYQYKFVVDGEWLAADDNPQVEDNGNVNNVIEVEARETDTSVLAARARLLSEGGSLTDEERRRMHELVCSRRPNAWERFLGWLRGLFGQ